ncbi:MAG: hypothetical protein ACI4SR_00050 [Faecalibacillus sp.]
MKRLFYIDSIKTEDINKLSIKLNEMQEVSHIKIMKNSISFHCERPDNVQTFLNESNMDYILKEMINKTKREYVSSQNKVKQFFMFENLTSEEEAEEIREVLSKYSVYEDVEVDFQNKMLTLTTANKNALNRISRIVENINPQIHVEQWKKPFKSQDIFNEKFVQKYIRIATFCVGFAIGLVTKNDVSFLTYVGWLLALAVCSENVIQKAKKDIQLKQYFSEHILILIACLGGWACKAFIEAIIVSAFYQVGQVVMSYVSHNTFSKIDGLLNKERVGRRLTQDGEEMVPLTDFDIGDILVVNEGETVTLGGHMVKGNAQLDMYAIDGRDVLADCQIGDRIYSGTIVKEGFVQVKVSVPYEDSAMNNAMNIAMNAPVTKSKTEEIIDRISMIYTIALIFVGILCCVIGPFVARDTQLNPVYLGIIMVTMAGSSIYKQGASFSLLAGIAKALTKKISIKENSGLDDLNTCATIIYDRFDGIETTDDEMDLFEKLSHLHKSLIIFNDGPVDMEDEQYLIYNNLSVEEKLDIMNKVMIAGPVAYIGDCDKDIVLLQNASIGISRGGVHNQNVLKNSDIVLASSNYDTIVDLFNITKKQKAINIENTFIGIVVSLLVVLLATISIMPWWLAIVVYYIESILVLINTQRITYL